MNLSYHTIYTHAHAHTPYDTRCRTPHLRTFIIYPLKPLFF